ncbi:MAG: hypothetical protein ACRD1C_04305 [Terriglobales bacterium]
MNSFGAQGRLAPGGPEIYRLDVLEKSGVGPVSRLPYAMKILLGNLLRHEDGRFVTADDITRLANWDPRRNAGSEKLLSRRRGCCCRTLPEYRRGGDAKLIGPQQPAELVIAHSVQCGMPSARASSGSLRLAERLRL